MSSLPYFLARRIHFSKGDDTQRVSPPAVRIAIAGVAIGVAVMLLTVAIVVGFKEEVRQRVIDFSGHLQIQAFTPNQTYELPPLTISDSLRDVLRHQPGLTELRGVVTKPAVLKADSDFVSVVAKGAVEFREERSASGADEEELSADEEVGEESSEVSADEGLKIAHERSGVKELGEREVALSQTIADRLRVGIGDEVTAYFVQSDLAANPFALGAENTKVKARRLTVAQIYATHFSEIDQQMVLMPIALLQGVSGWTDEMYSMVEVHIDDFDLLADRCYQLNTSGLVDTEGVQLFAMGIDQLNPQVFSWLELLDANVWVILILIAAVATFTMISGLLIIILERTQMIGILRAQGLDNGRLRRVFLWVALFLTGRGMLWGNALGLALAYIQWRWHIMALDPETYYLEWVPIHLTPWMIVAVNVGTILITLLVLIGPSALVASISPARTMQAE